MTILDGVPALFGRYDEDVAQVAREIIAIGILPLTPAYVCSPSKTALTR